MDAFISIRNQQQGEMLGEHLMLACYILGQHKQIEDCLKIWEAKTVDFDTYCGVDIQLVAFAGVAQTIAYLKSQTTSEASEALEYVTKCDEAGDFDELEKYYSSESLPWYV